MVGLFARRVDWQGDDVGRLTGGTRIGFRSSAIQEIDHGSDEEQYAEHKDTGGQFDELQLRQLLKHLTETRGGVNGQRNLLIRATSPFGLKLQAFACRL